MIPIARGSNRPATSLYLFSGRSQPVGITALLATHTIRTLPPADRPPGPCWQAPGSTRKPPLRPSCPPRTPYAPQRDYRRAFCHVAAVHSTGSGAVSAGSNPAGGNGRGAKIEQNL